ncbi:MAG TPA: ABC transporter, partial [Ruminococcaceae bacterium]|nr:ABC transporter [Oscillospiraceae bacterium]
EAAKSLVYPDGIDFGSFDSENEHIIRVVFNGASATNKPLIAQMAIEKNIAADILSASTRSIGGKAYGNMLLGIPGDE